MMIVLTALFIVLDFLTGVLSAVKQKVFNSSTLRDGLFHKVSFVLCIILGELCDFAQGYVDLGFSLPILSAICVYIIFTEISSIVENIGKINPEILPSKLTSIFLKVKVGEKE